MIRCRFFIYLFSLYCLAFLAGCASHKTGGAVSSTSPAAMVNIAADKRAEVILAALLQLDRPYRYGGASPETGFDCSGLVQFVVAQATHVQLPRNTQQQARVSRPIKRHELANGDLVFFNTLDRPHSHVGIYLGEGQFINAPSSGGRVRIDSLDNPWFAKRFEGGRTLYDRR